MKLLLEKNELDEIYNKLFTSYSNFEKHYELSEEHYNKYADNWDKYFKYDRKLFTKSKVAMYTSRYDLTSKFSYDDFKNKQMGRQYPALHNINDIFVKLIDCIHEAYIYGKLILDDRDIWFINKWLNGKDINSWIEYSKLR